ncbi:MAG: hypothetical protein ABSA30_11290 [Candidatus Aminicenantales bacterium]
MSIVYGAIADILSVVLAVVAFTQAREKGRIAILVLMICAFGVPHLWPSRTAALVCFLAKILIAIGCYIYIRWSNAM